MLAKFTPWFEQAFAKHAPEEEILWELGLITLVDPRPNGTNEDGSPRTSFISSIVLHIEVPGVVEGTFLANTALMNGSTITEEFADETVRDLVVKIPAQRAMQERSMADQQEQSVRNGQPTPTHGML